MSAKASKSSVRSARGTVAVAGVNETEARKRLKPRKGEVLRLFCFEFSAGNLWLRIDADTIDYLCSLSKGAQDMGVNGVSVLDLVADPAALETFFVDKSPVIYWRRPGSTNVDVTGWKPLSDWAKEQVNPLRK